MSRLKVLVAVVLVGALPLPAHATKVTVDYKYSVFFPLFFGTEIALSSESKMRIE